MTTAVSSRSSSASTSPDTTDPAMSVVTGSAVHQAPKYRAAHAGTASPRLVTVTAWASAVLIRTALIGQISSVSWAYT
ncbi:hypothetical protein R1T08_02945 [Streptomyces sp. SBC-4]|nr:hypothetical protein [Streptomyces sp. SBC-4]MDV5143293.1 hypothetical protein [Streptomyces sp. SBC-4]